MRNAVDVEGDGDCGFRTISFLISGTEGNHAVIRKAVCDLILKRTSTWINLITGGCEEPTSNGTLLVPYSSTSEYLSFVN
uniref:OTU domain-containing protein n=1 Tax=Steinernema glaseri TaxID=37863 RepID=A0A1I7YHU9_9BILA